MNELKNIKHLGIWMDHSKANLIDIEDNSNSKTIESNFNHNPHSSNANINHKENNLLEAYYKTIADNISKYTDVILFGPTNAKLELKNHLRKDPHFDNIYIEVKSSDKMTHNEEIAFVKEHFANYLHRKL